jgi:hypothetical protein
VLRWDATVRALRGTDDTGGAVELLRGGRSRPDLREGLWLARWTGLPVGMGVETRIARHPDGRWRVDYQYSGSGGVRDGSFEGTLVPPDTLVIGWTEVTESGTLARGRGRLLATPFGLRGTFGIDGNIEGTGEWVLEPLEP